MRVVDQAARAGEALLEAREWLAEALPTGWSRRVGESVVSVTGIPAPTLNGVWSTSSDSHHLDELLSAVDRTGLPYCLQIPSSAATRPGVLTGLRRDEDVPLMVAGTLPEPVPVPPGFSVRPLDAAEAARHCEIAGLGFGAPAELFEPLAALASERAELTIYLGEVNGEPVTTGLALLLGDRVGVFNIATPPEHRRHGFGAAITATIVSDAFAAGAGWAWLQSSPEGRPVYERLGFATVDTWQCWVS